MTLKFFVYGLLFLTISLWHSIETNPGEAQQQKESLALFPFENLTDNKDALALVMPVLRERLQEIAGNPDAKLLDEDSLNRFLLKERIRSTGYVFQETAQKLRDELKVKAIMVGSVNLFATLENPQLGISARLINSSDGLILWAGHASATGQDFSTVLGLGKIGAMPKLITKVVDQLFNSFSITPSVKEGEAIYKIAVMPFQNKSKTKDAGMITTYIFLGELFKSKRFIPVEYGLVRKLVVDLRIREKGELDRKRLQALSKSLGVDGILLGTVELYPDGNDLSTSEVAISARLLDAGKNKILWADSYQGTDDKAVILFDWSNVKPADRVASKIVSKLVRKMESAKWHQ